MNAVTHNNISRDNFKAFAKFNHILSKIGRSNSFLIGDDVYTFCTVFKSEIDCRQFHEESKGLFSYFQETGELYFSFREDLALSHEASRISNQGDTYYTAKGSTEKSFKVTLVSEVTGCL